MDAPTLYLLLALGSGLVLGLITGMLKTSTAVVAAGAAAVFGIILPVPHPIYWFPLLEVALLYGGAGALGAWTGIELRDLAQSRLRPTTSPASDLASTETAGYAVNSLGAQKKEFREAICCPHCGATSIDWWDKLMSGLIGRHCICDNCGASSREPRKRRFITSAVFLGTLWLIGLIPHLVYANTALLIWAFLLLVVEWHYIYAIPLVPVVDSARWKTMKDIFAWGFIALIFATFAFAAILQAV